MNKESQALDGLFPEKRAAAFILSSGSKLVAALTVILSVAVIFADVRFASIGTVGYTSTLLVLLASTYLMYFSLEDVGERAGEATEEAKEIYARYESARGRVKPEDIPKLRDFLSEYSREELSFRRKMQLASGGLTEDDLQAYLSGKKYPRREGAVLKKAKRARAVPLTPIMLLSGADIRAKSELLNPERYKFLGLILKLIPTTLCMTFTVSLVLTAKDGLSVSSVMDGIFKLSSLPLAGLRGYRAGYVFARYTRTSWYEVKTRILEAYLKKSEAA